MYTINSRKRITKKMCLFLGLFLLIFTGICMAEQSSKSNKTSENAGRESVLYIKDMDIFTFLKALSVKHKVNIVSTPGVKGKVSINLRDTNLEDTLTAVTKSMGLSWTKEGSIYVVSNPGKGGKNSKTVRIFHINYADLKELCKVIQWSFEGIRSTIYSHERILLLEGEPRQFSKIERLIRSLDIPPKQALIEARILEISLNDDKAYGLDWGDTFSQGQRTEGQVNSPGPQFPPNISTTEASASKFFFGVTRPSFYLKLSALEQRGDVKTLATPRLMVLDGKSAEINIGGQKGYHVTTITETTTSQGVEFLNIGTKLKITPQITEEGNIIMNINPEVSDGEISSDGVPSKTSTEVKTSIMVKAGETIFIGGLIRNSEIKRRSHIPVLGRIPLLGKFLFSSISTQMQNKELVVLLTPYLFSANQKIVHRDDVGEGNINEDIERWQKKIEGIERSKKCE